MLASPQEVKKAGSFAEKWDPEDELGEVSLEEELVIFKAQEEAKARQRKSRVQRIEVRQWRDKEHIEGILNQPLLPVDVQTELATTTQLIHEGILRNMKGDEKSGLWWSSEGEEVVDFRRLMQFSAHVDEQEWLKRHPNCTLEEALSISPLPRFVAASLPSAQEANIPAEFDLTLEASTTHTLRFATILDADAVISAALRSAQPDLASRYVLKVVGKRDYIWGSTRMVDFTYIRKCVLGGILPVLSLVEVSEEECDESLLRYTFRDVSEVKVSSSFTGNVQETKERTDGAKPALRYIDDADSHLYAEYHSYDMNTDIEVSVESLSCICLPRHLAKEGEEGRAMYVSIVGQIFHGTEGLTKPIATPWRVVNDIGAESLSNAVWGGDIGTLRFPFKLCNLPRDGRLCFSAAASFDKSFVTKTKENLAWDASSLLESEDDKEDEGSTLFYLGWVNLQFFDHVGCLQSGKKALKMWLGEQANPIGVVSTPKKESHLALGIRLQQFAKPVQFEYGEAPAYLREALVEKHKQRMNALEPHLRKNVVNQIRQVRSVIQKDPLYRLTDVDKILLWQFRGDLIENPHALSKFLQAIEWSSPAAVQDCISLLFNEDKAERWSLPPAGEELLALELLDARYANSKVREYALSILDRLPDPLLQQCILQLVQVLKYEPYHYSALSRFLLKRSVNSPHLVGHAVFWHLKAEMGSSAVQERHGLLVEEMLRRVPVPVRRGFEKQDALVEVMLKIAIDIKKTKQKDRNPALRVELEKVQKILSDDIKFTLPLDPRMECSGLKVEKCKVMDSKKLPLWLVFKNADPQGAPIYVIFKAGDDLRQDLLTLQIITMMDTMWKAQGMDLRMSPYGCVACDDGVGMIEVVLNSETIANITKKSGGASMAFKEEPMTNWLRKQDCNRSPEGIKKCMYNFIYSCSGYCVATYILGIGDRHNDNIMLQEDGTLFHIDFGHFLGNFKAKFGIKRETSPFVFTPMYAYVLGGEKSGVYKHFVSVACDAYNIVRKSSHIIVSLFALMLSTGIPELEKPDDIEWLQKVLLVGEDDNNARGHYEDRIRESLANKRILLNDYIHIRVHSK